MAEFTGSFSPEATFDQVDELVVRLQEGEEGAFDEVFHLYRDMVYTLALKLLADKAEAMDVTQEVFVTLFQKIRSFRGESSLKTWLYRIAVNQASSRNRWWSRGFRRRSNCVTLNIESNERILNLRSKNPSPARSCLSGELRDAIHTAMQKLPFEQRVAVALREVEGLNYEEIAEVTGASVGTVKSRIARGREKLREVLQGFRGGRSI